MKISTKTTSKLIVLLVIAVAFGFVASSCDGSDNSADPEPTQEPAKREDNSHLEKSACEQEHIVGGSNCPQDVCSVPVYCGRDENSCTADSAAFAGQQPGLECTFGNGQTWTALDSDPTKGTNLNVKFTCQVAQSFERTYTINFYNQGNKVDEQDFKVKMNVK